MTDRDLRRMTDDERASTVVNAIVRLWLVIQALSEVGEEIEANNVHLPMARLCAKYHVPLPETHTDTYLIN